MAISDSFRKEVLTALSESCDLDEDGLDKLLNVPPDPDNGDFSIPCFAFARTLRKAPKVIAEELAANICLGESFSKVEAVNGYLNFHLNPLAQLRSVLTEISVQKDSYGSHPLRREKVLLDYSSPNIGKELAFHHIRSTMIGNSLARIFTAAGYDVIRINHLGDWGTAFGKLIVMYRREGLPEDESSLAAIEVSDLNRLYSAFSAESQKDTSLEDSARAAFAKLEEGDKDIRKLWKAFREATLRELRRVYKMLNVEFDDWTGEAFFNDRLDGVVEELKKAGILALSQEREVVLLDEEDMPPCLIRKSDGSSLYATRDLAAALYRMEKFAFRHCLYVVDNGQALHFRQVFRVLEKMGKDWTDRLEHIPFGVILNKNEGGKWEKGKSRSGVSALLRDVLEAAQKTILEHIDKKNPDLENKNEIALQVGVAGLVFSDLRNRRLNDVKFDWDKALSFEGDTGPYVQNAHVRLCSILEKVGVPPRLEDADLSQLTEGDSLALIKVLARLSDRIEVSCREREPYIISQYALDLAEAVHRFLHRCRVLGSAEEKSRLVLVDCSRIVLARVLELLSITAIRKM